MKITKDNVANLAKRLSKVVCVGEYEVRIIQMSIPQQIEIEEVSKNKKSSAEIIAPMLKFCIVDDDNNQLLDDNLVNNLPANVATELFKHCVEFNSLSEKELEERAKNL